MALPMADMDTALQAAGIPFVEVGYQPADPTGAPDWRSRGRPASTGPFNPTGVLCHHTASPAGTSDHTDISVILAGNGDAPGPISQIYIGRTGTVYLIAAGRANHGGKGIRPGIDSGCADMNAALLGIEAGNNGIGEPWADNMTTAYGRVVLALCQFYAWDIRAVYLHATTGPPSGGCNSKIDPAGPWQRQPDIGAATWNLDVWRQFCLDVGGEAPVPKPPNPHNEERRRGMSDFVVSYGMDAQGIPNGAVYEMVNGRKRPVWSDEWFEILKGVAQREDGSVPDHAPWQPVAAVTNGWALLGAPDYIP
jgi:hypothetical protein